VIGFLFTFICNVCGEQIKCGSVKQPRDYAALLTHLNSPRHADKYPWFARLNDRRDLHQDMLEHFSGGWQEMQCIVALISNCLQAERHGRD
jgi:hypothetical protein